VSDITSDTPEPDPLVASDSTISDLPAEPQPPPAQPVELHPIRLVVTDDLRRSRLTVLLRLPLAVPHFLWLYLFGIVASLALVIAWFVGIFLGRIPSSLHRFLASYARYSTHVTAYVSIAANPFPGFTGNLPYPVDLEIAPAVKQGRLRILFRLVLAIPALVVAYLLQIVLYTIAVIAWFAALFTGRVEKSLRDILTFCIRYLAQTNAYVFLLTKRYPTFKDT
jgi:Domain of unknown function (DUF4389)